MRQKKKKMNSYVKIGLVSLGFALLGAAIGFCIAFFDVEHFGGGVGSFIINGVRNMLLPLLALIFAVSVLMGEMLLRKLKALGEKLSVAENEEGDELEYQMEFMGGVSVASNNLFQIIDILVISTGYSLAYISGLDKKGAFIYMISCVIFIANSIYCSYQQLRYVKTVQKAFPEKKGDPSSRKFQEEWLKSCDEAERELIYQSAYKCHIRTMKVLPILAVLSMITHLIWNTGIMAVIMVCIIWALASVSYCRECIKGKGQQINEC